MPIAYTPKKQKFKRALPFFCTAKAFENASQEKNTFCIAQEEELKWNGRETNLNKGRSRECILFLGS
jgi:hypothetical protein